MVNGKINNKSNLYNDSLAFQFNTVICPTTDVRVFDLIINRLFSYFCKIETSHLLGNLLPAFLLTCKWLSMLIAEAFCFRMTFQHGKWNPIPDSQRRPNKLSINWCQAESFSPYLSSDSLACQKGLICLMRCHNLWGLDDVQCWFFLAPDSLAYSLLTCAK